MNIAKILVSVGAAVALSLGAGVASADYICSAHMVPGSGTGGTQGFVFVVLYTGPNCTGNYTNSYYFCTTGATATACIANTMLQHNSVSLGAFYQVVQRAAIHDERVVPYANTCIGGSGACGAYLTLY